MLPAELGSNGKCFREGLPQVLRVLVKSPPAPVLVWAADTARTRSGCFRVPHGRHSRTRSVSGCATVITPD